jgi:hypothetical protein
MADTTTVDTYPKATNTQAEVQAIAQNHLANGAKSSVVTEDATNWIVTTVWPGGC